MIIVRSVKNIIARTSHSQNPGKYQKPLPKWISKILDEEQQAILIDLRSDWYENKPDHTWTHLTVWMKTQHHVFIEVWLNELKYQIKHFNSRIPRL